METGSEKRKEVSEQDVKVPLSAPVAVEILQPSRANLHSNDAPKQQVSDLEKRVRRNEQPERRLTVVIALATLISALVAGLQWRAMEKQLIESRQATQRQIQPYLLSRAELVTPTVGQPIRIKHFVTNYGQSPALKTQVVGAVFYGASAMEQVQAWMKSPENSFTETGSGLIIPPGAQADGRNDRMFVVKTNYVLTDDDVAMLRETDYLVVTVSRYVYQDSFGDFYGTQNCFRVTKELELSDCPRQNEMYGPGK